MWHTMLSLKKVRFLGNPGLSTWLLFSQLPLLAFTLLSISSVSSGWLPWRDPDDSIFLILCGVILLIAIPFQMNGRLALEMHHRIREPERIAAGRSVSGLVWRRWFSATLRMAVLAGTMVPYIFLRYFFGASSLLRNLEVFGLIFLTGMVLTALLLSLSVYRGILKFVLLLMVCLIIFLLIRFSEAFTMQGLIPFPMLVMVLIDAILVITVLLEAGVSKIAPPEENTALFKRLIALIALGGAFLFSRLGIPAPSAYGAASVIILYTLLDGLSEPLPPVVSSQRSRLAYFLSVFFLPGWASASLFSLLIFIISLKILRWERVSQEPRMALIFASLFAGVLWPAAFIRFFLPKTRHFAICYCLFQIAGGAVAFLIYSLPSKMNGFWDVLVSFAPSAVFFLATTKILPPTGLDIYLWVSTILCCWSLLLLLARVFLTSIR